MLRLSLLGPFTAAIDDSLSLNIPTQKALALLIFLAVERDNAHRREYLFTLLWPGMPEKSARHNLSQVLYEIRQALPSLKNKSIDPVPLLVADRQTINLHPEAEVDVDVQQLESLVQRAKKHDHPNLADCESCIKALEEAIELYRGDFLMDFYLEDSNLFEDWAEAVRGRCRSLVLDACKTLAEVHKENREYGKANTILDRGLGIDNLMEDFHHYKMEVMAKRGQRVEALRHFREFAQLLESELGATPSQEITALYERIRVEDLVQDISNVEREPREAKPPRHNLVPQLTPFIGREEELAKLDAMLADPDTRLITIIGPGGMGKTRLAIACAERQLRMMAGNGYHFPDGVFFVPLADIVDPEQIPHEISKALNLSLNAGGIAERGSISFKIQILSYLKHKRILLVLDNFEQLLEGAKLLTEILKVSADVQLIITSRDRMHLQAEQVFPIDGLEFPDWEAPEESYEYTAMQLFLESARRVRPEFEITKGDMVPLTRICKLVGGMPLGLELAASWLGILSVVEVAAEIQLGMDILETDVRDLPARHRSLRVVCDSTWECLNEIEKDIFARLSVFRGGFNREAAKEVAGASLQSLASMQDKSLIGFDPTHMRYRIHPYLRQYGIERLEVTPVRCTESFNRHCDYFCSYIEKYTYLFLSGQSQYAYNQMDKEFPNLLTAWEWAIDYKNVTCIAKMIDGLYLYYQWNYREKEILSICRQANLELTSIRASQGKVKTKVINRIEITSARIFNYLGFHTFPVDNDQGTLFFDESKQILKNLANAGFDTRAEKAQLLRFQAYYLDFKASKPLLLESTSISKENNDHWGYLESLSFGTNQALLAGRLQEAKDWSIRGLKFSQARKNHWWEISFILDLARITRRLRIYPEAIQYYKNAISLIATCNEDRSLEFTYLHFSWLMLFLGNLEEATSFSCESKKIAEYLGVLTLSWTLMSLGITQWLCGRFDAAEKSILDSIDSKHGWNPRMIMNGFIVYMEFLVLTGQYYKAKEEIKNRNSRLDEIDLKLSNEYCRYLRTVGMVNLVDNNFKIARKQLQESINAVQDNYEYKEEYSSWSKAFLAAAEYGVGNGKQTKEVLINALMTALKIQGYIPMVFNLPMTLLILADEDLELAAEVYQQVRRDPFLGKAQLYHDLVYKHLPEEITSIQVETVETSPEHRAGLWAAARKVLETWNNNGD